MGTDDQSDSFIIQSVKQLHHLHLFQRMKACLYFIIKNIVNIRGICQSFYDWNYLINHRGCYIDWNFFLLILWGIRRHISMFINRSIYQMIKYKLNQQIILCRSFRRIIMFQQKSQKIFYRLCNTARVLYIFINFYFFTFFFVSSCICKKVLYKSTAPYAMPEETTH